MEKLEEDRQASKAILGRSADWETIRDAGVNLFFVVLEKDPFCRDDQGRLCYWCKESAYYGQDVQHAEDCLWKQVRDFAYEIG